MSPVAHRLAGATGGWRRLRQSAATAPGTARRLRRSHAPTSRGRPPRQRARQTGHPARLASWPGARDREARQARPSSPAPCRPSGRSRRPGPSGHPTTASETGSGHWPTPMRSRSPARLPRHRQDARANGPRRRIRSAADEPRVPNLRDILRNPPHNASRRCAPACVRNATAAACRPTHQRAGAPSSAPGLLGCQEGGVSMWAPDRRPGRAPRVIAMCSRSPCQTKRLSRTSRDADGRAGGSADYCVCLDLQHIRGLDHCRALHRAACRSDLP